MIGALIRPWTLLERVVCFEILDPDNRTVAMIDKPYRLDRHPQAGADARLAVKAPELLLRSEELLAAIDRRDLANLCRAECDALRLVLAEARGIRTPSKENHPHE